MAQRHIAVLLLKAVPWLASTAVVVWAVRMGATDKQGALEAGRLLIALVVALGICTIVGLTLYATANERPQVDERHVVRITSEHSVFPDECDWGLLSGILEDHDSKERVWTLVAIEVTNASAEPAILEFHLVYNATIDGEEKELSHKCQSPPMQSAADSSFRPRLVFQSGKSIKKLSILSDDATVDYQSMKLRVVDKLSRNEATFSLPGKVSLDITRRKR